MGGQQQAWDKQGSGFRGSLSFVTVRALLGIELIRRNAKDVVALDTDAVEKDLRRLGRLRRTIRGCRNWGVRSLTHEGILS
jgi:hypothetical protein